MRNANINFITYSACIIFVFILNSIASAQGIKIEIPPEWNFIKQKEQYIKTIGSTVRDTSRDNPNTFFGRWEWFWNKRFDRNGDMRTYGKLMTEQYSSAKEQAKSGACQTDCAFSCFQADWRYLGPEFLNTQNLGKVNCIWVNPNNSNNILVGADAGLWKTVNGGLDWVNISDFCLPSIGVHFIAVSPGNTDVIYISTGIGVGVTGGHSYGYGVFKTTDGGTNWQKMNIDGTLGMEESVSKRIIIHPLNNNNIYVTLGCGVYKSTDNGNTWGQLFGVTQNSHKQILVDMELIPSGTLDEVYVSSQTRNLKECSPCNPTCTGMVVPGSSYVTTGSGYCAVRATAKVWKFSSPFNAVNASSHTDVSATITGWPDNTDRVSLSITPTTINVACGIDNTNSYALKLFRKVGVNWSNIGNVNLGHNAGSFEVSAQNTNMIYIGGVQLIRSTNGGASFQYFTPSHVDVRFLSIYQSVSNGNDVLYFGTDGGISKSVNGGTVSSNLNGNNLQLTQFYGISNSEILGNQIYGGTQDNGAFDNSNQSWRVKVIGDAYDAVVDVVNPSIAYITSGPGYGPGTINKTSDGGNSWPSFGCPPGENCQNRPLVIDKNNRLYVGDNNLWRWNAGSSTWEQITFLNTGRPICSITMTDDGNTACIVYSDIFWGGTPSTYANRIFRITNLNSTAVTTDITAGLSGYMWASPTDVVIEPVSGNKIWVSFGNLDVAAKVFEFDANSSTWTNYSQGLPNIPTSTLAYLRGSNDLLFLGTDDGVYYRHDGLSQWQRFSCNLPRAIVTDLEINYKLNRLRAATYGRGVWETPIPKLFIPSCAVPSTVSANVGTSGYTMTNGQTINVTAQTATVSINYAGTCYGGDCCSSASNNISWTAYRKQISPGTSAETVAGSGIGGNINFPGTFKTTFPMLRKYQYRVEIKHNCSGNDCGTINLMFKGI